MISIDEAFEYVLRHAAPKASQRVPLGDALDWVLAEDIFSDLDVPPQDLSLVDGYAVRSTDFSLRSLSDPEAGAAVELAVLEEVTAGNVPTCEVATGKTVRVMTGVGVPEGADAVVMIEESVWQQEAGLDLGVASFTSREVVAGQNIMPCGRSLRRGQLVLPSGTRIRPAEIGLLAQAGRTGVRVVTRPRVAVLPTGDELVDAGFFPGPGKIRNSNGPMLIAAARQLGVEVVDLGIGRDDREQLLNAVERGLQADVLMISGGVSAGVLDLVPEVLEQLGVRPIFHKVRLKPGKPLWFGVADNSNSGTNSDTATLVFGLPGNPVSSFVCFQLFVRIAIKRMSGQIDIPSLTTAFAPLARGFDVRADRTTYHPAHLQWSETGATIDPVSWHGSGDLRALATANALAVFPEGQEHYEPGQWISYQPLD